MIKKKGKKKVIPVIDLFAGPGGLGEGFSACQCEEGQSLFKISLSIEKDFNAHQTLELRSFFRQFPKDMVPDAYYSYLRQEISRDELFKRHPVASCAARKEAHWATLGDVNEKELDGWIEEALGGKNKEWVLIGGPPCQAYSLAGRSRNKGNKAYSPEGDKRHFLYQEYLRIIGKHWPSVFVMENVKGILSSKVNGESIFDCIHMDLQNPGKAAGTEERYRYRIFSLVPSNDNLFGRSNEYTVRCEDYGVPQARHRVILLGVRCSEDLDGMEPRVLKKADATSVMDVLSGLPVIRSGLSRDNNGKSWVESVTDMESSEWLVGVDQDIRKVICKRLKELKTLGNSMTEIGNQFTETEVDVCKKLKTWFLDSRIKGVCNHISRGHMATDLHRYFFAACYAELYKKTPTLNDFPEELLPNHKNVSAAIKDKTLFNDRFRVQVWSRPSTTVTCHIAKDGHYYIHPDPVQCRSLSVREAARLQTFPDNYYFCGSRTAQFTQVGNAVPPLLARQIAEIVAGLLKDARRN